MTTLIKRFFPQFQQLQDHLIDRFPVESPAVLISTIIQIGYLNDLLAEPRPGRNSRNADSYLAWLENKYLTSKQNHTGVRGGEPVQTIADPLVDIILAEKFRNFTEEDILSISRHHRLSMFVENLIGNYLEEYLDEKLSESGWICCYGQILKYSDFCHSSNLILQVKNRDNTENSSSKKIRANNERIKMWFRTFSKTGRTNWESIYSRLKVLETDEHNIINGVEIFLNEDDFQNFVRIRVSRNANIIYNEL